MLDTSTEYHCFIDFDRYLPDSSAWRDKLLQIGLHNEAFSISVIRTGKLMVKFWEPDRPEALRILAKIDAMTALSSL